MRAPQSPPEPAGLQNLLPSKQCVSHRLISLIVFQNGHISGALAELIRSTRAPIKDRLIGKDHGGDPMFRGTRGRSTRSPSWCPRAGAGVAGGEVSSNDQAIEKDRSRVLFLGCHERPFNRGDRRARAEA